MNPLGTWSALALPLLSPALQRQLTGWFLLAVRLKASCFTSYSPSLEIRECLGLYLWVQEGSLRAPDAMGLPQGLSSHNAI